jgi:uncharacterized membrane protein YkvI
VEIKRQLSIATHLFFLLTVHLKQELGAKFEFKHFLDQLKYLFLLINGKRVEVKIVLHLIFLSWRQSVGSRWQLIKAI